MHHPDQEQQVKVGCSTRVDEVEFEHCVAVFKHELVGHGVAHESVDKIGNKQRDSGFDGIAVERVCAARHHVAHGGQSVVIAHIGYAAESASGHKHCPSTGGFSPVPGRNKKRHASALACVSAKY